MLNISLSFQVLPEGLQRRSFEFAQIDIVRFPILPLATRMNWLCKDFQTVPMWFSKFIPLRFEMKSWNLFPLQQVERASCLGGLIPSLIKISVQVFLF